MSILKREAPVFKSPEVVIHQSTEKPVCAYCGGICPKKYYLDREKDLRFCSKEHAFNLHMTTGLQLTIKKVKRTPRGGLR